MRRTYSVLLAAVTSVSCFLLVASNLEAQNYMFNRATFVTGKFPTGVALADFNGDGRRDIAVVNQNDSTISILLGKPDGTMSSKMEIPTAINPSQVIAVDFNGDGKMDLAVTVGSAVSILLGNGDGTFQPHAEFGTGGAPYGLVAADFNHDGKLDLAVANSSTGTVSVLLGNGNGTFQPKTDYATGPSPISVIAADFNGDGSPDLAVACFSFNGNSSTSISTLSILLGNGDGTFQSQVNYTTDYATSGVATADFNGDGKLDLVVATASAIDLLVGNGDGTFQSVVQIPEEAGTSATSVFTADLNHDGKMDFVVANGGGVSIFLGNGDGTFRNQIDALGSGGQGALAIGDVNGDGALDLAMTAWFTNTVAVLLGNGDGTFSPLQPLPALPLYQNTGWTAGPGTFADFNGDGKLDIAVAAGNQDYPGQGAVVVFPGNGDGTMGSPIINNIGATRLTPTDFNGDGKVDLAFADSKGAGVALGNGDGTFGSINQIFTSYGIPALQVLTADLNNDGNTDVIILANGFTTTPPVYVFLGNGDGTFTGLTHFWSGTQVPTGISTADFNKDGKPDLLMTLNPSGFVVMLGKGDGTFQAPVLFATNDLPYATAADVNGDGNPDLIVTDSDNSQVDVYLGQGNGTFGSPYAYSSGQFPDNIVTGDFNGDGKVDLAVLRTSGSSMSILFGNGDGTFQSPISILAQLPEGPLAVADFNHDGITDILVGSGLVGMLDLATGAGSGGIFLSKPIASLYPSSLNFGTLTEGTTSAAKSITLINVGDAPLSLSRITASAGFAATSQCGASLQKGSTCTIDVTFTPSTPGEVQGALTLVDNTTLGAHSVALVGVGTGTAGALPVATLSPNSLTFSGQLAGTSSGPESVTLTNSGNTLLTIDGITAGGDFSETDNCASTVPISGTCSILVVFKPTGGGTRTGSLTIIDTATNSPQTVNLLGTGYAPDLSLSPETVSFGLELSGTTSAAKSLTVTNGGTAPLTFANISVGGNFALASSGTTCSSNSPLATKAACAISMTFSPTETGLYTGTLTLTDNNNGLPVTTQTVSLTGTGTDSELSLSTTSVAFLAQLSGTSSPPFTVALMNTGSTPVSISGMTVSGDFAQTNSCGSSISAGGNCSISVTFTPTAVGNRTGTLSIADNANNSPQTISLSGIGDGFSFVPYGVSTTSATVTAGQQATYMLSVVGEEGLTGTVTFTCTGAPSQATCTASPASLTVGSAATTVTITVNTTAPTAATTIPRHAPPAPPLSPEFKLILMLALPLAATVWAFAQGKRKSLRMWRFGLIPLAAGLMLALALAGCGGGGGGGGGGPVGNPGTPSGTYSLTVTGTTGSGATALSHAVTLTLKVS